MLRLERAYKQAGARYLAGSGTSAFGTMPGISLHTELALLVRIGLTPREALAAATGNYGALGPWRRLGRVAPGHDADLVLLDADPTADIRNAKRVHAVVANGRYLDRAALDALLARTERPGPGAGSSVRPARRGAGGPAVGPERPGAPGQARADLVWDALAPAGP